MIRRSDIAASGCVLLAGPLLLLLLTQQVSGFPAAASTPANDGHTQHRHTRSLLDDDLVTAGLQVFAPGPRSRCCRQLTLCDLATTLLQAVEANKAQDAETYRRREQDSHRFQGLLGRFRRARYHPGGEQDDANPVFTDIARTYMRRLREDEDARRQHALRQAEETIERERRLAAERHQEEEDDDGDESTPSPGPPSAIQAIPKKS